MTADAMGLLPKNFELRTLDSASFGKVASAIRNARIGNAAVADFAESVDCSTAQFVDRVRALRASLRECPVPERELPALEPLLGTEMLARLLSLSPQTIRRYSAGERSVPSDVSARLHFLALTVGALRGAYNDEGVRRWFVRTRSQLGGRSPAQLLRRGWTPEEEPAARILQLAESLVGLGAT